MNGKLFVYTQKTGVPVFRPLPQFVVDALNGFEPGGEFFFWSGESDRVFELAGVVNGHRFRDTFAVELLLRGVPLERISILLGHRSVKVTERHYAPWALARPRAVGG